MYTFEVEIKVFLETEERADVLISALKKRDKKVRLKGQSFQLNHYFDDHGNFQSLIVILETYLKPDQLGTLHALLQRGKKHSLRTRDADGYVSMVVKADREKNADSMHGNTRYEWEEIIPDMTIEALDAHILKHGFSCLSKWSRQRKEYQYLDMTVCIDNNAGYGYVAELEKVVQREQDADRAKEAIKNELQELGLEELSQERLGRMFAHYNAHWQEYYRTDKTFIIE